MKWQGTAIWADESRLEDGSVGCAVARYDPEHDAWTGVRVCMGKNQEAYGAELHRPMLTLFQEPPRPEDRHLRGRTGSLTEDHIRRTRHRTAIHSRDRTTVHDLWVQRGVSVQFRWVTSNAGTAGIENADYGSTERTRFRATALRPT